MRVKDVDTVLIQKREKECKARKKTKGRERCDRSHDLGEKEGREATGHMTNSSERFLAFHSVGEAACQTSYIGFLMERWNVERCDTGEFTTSHLT